MHSSGPLDVILLNGYLNVEKRLKRLAAYDIRPSQLTIRVTPSEWAGRRGQPQPFALTPQHPRPNQTIAYYSFLTIQERGVRQSPPHPDQKQPEAPRVFFCRHRRLVPSTRPSKGRRRCLRIQTNRQALRMRFVYQLRLYRWSPYSMAAFSCRTTWWPLGEEAVPTSEIITGLGQQRLENAKRRISKAFLLIRILFICWSVFSSSSNERQ